MWLSHQHNFKDKASKISFNCTIDFSLVQHELWAVHYSSWRAPEKCSCWGSDQSRIREMPGTGKCLILRAEWSNVPWATLSTLADCGSTAGNWDLCMQCFFFTYFCPSKESPAARTVFTGIYLRYQHVVTVLLRWGIREGLTIAEMLASGIYKPQAGTPSNKPGWSELHPAWPSRDWTSTISLGKLCQCLLIWALKKSLFALEIWKFEQFCCLELLLGFLNL